MFVMFMYYYNLTDFYKKKFGCKVAKLAFNGGFSCPNRENGGSGCIFCTGSDEFAGKVTKTLKQQYEDQKFVVKNKWPDAKFIAYFGSYTNTYAPTSVLKEKFLEALSFEDVIGISIGTRCDCISDDCFKFLEELNKKTFLTVELGLQSIHNETLKFINRGHDLESFDKMVKRLKEASINVVVHIIDGLPFETEDMMLETIRHLNDLEIDGIKIHNLYVAKRTVLEKLYLDGKFELMSMNQYINIVCKQLEILNPKIVVHRLTGETMAEKLVAPTWAREKINILNGVVKKLKKDKSYQGKYYKKSH